MPKSGWSIVVVGRGGTGLATWIGNFTKPHHLSIFIYFFLTLKRFFWFRNLGQGFDLVSESFSKLSEWKWWTVSLFYGGIWVNDWDLEVGMMNVLVFY
jgi:hypothetical protein